MLTILVGCCEGCAEKNIPVLIQDEKAKDDFYEYVNHDFLSYISLGNQSVQWTWFGELDASIHYQFKNLIQSAKEDPEAKKEEAICKILDLDACISDWDSRNRDGLWKLQSNLEKLEQCTSIEEYVDCLAETYAEYGLASLLGGYVVDADYLDSQQNAVYLLGADTLLGKEYYEDPDMASTVSMYTSYIEEMLTIYGVSEQEAKDKATQIQNFVKDLSLHSLAIEEYMNPQKTYHRYSKQELIRLFHNANYEQVLRIEGIDQVDTFIVREVEQATWVNSILKEENLELLKWYSIFVALNDMAQYASREYAVCHQKMENKLYGTRNDLDNEDEKLYLEEQILPWEFAQVYTKFFYQNCDIQNIEDLVEKIKAAYLDILKHQDWMSAETKKKAQTKLKKMGIKIGFPDDMEWYLHEIEITPLEQGGSLIKNMLRYMHKNVLSQKEKIGKPVNKQNWSMTPQTINAYYSPTNNEIVFPAAILQPPFYSDEYSLGKNLGGIGFIIAHEMSHAFDSNGSMYDEKGNVNDWWSNEERKKYQSLGKNIIDYYQSYDVIGIPVNGELTLAENIADLGAMTCITHILEKDEAQLQEAFLQYASIWASKTSIWYQTYLLHSDCHAPNKVRVNAVLSSCDEFYQVYQIKPQDGMYKQRNRRVGIWQ